MMPEESGDKKNYPSAIYCHMILVIIYSFEGTDI